MAAPTHCTAVSMHNDPTAHAHTETGHQAPVIYCRCP